jgi:hypothetical protein
MAGLFRAIDAFNRFSQKQAVMPKVKLGHDELKKS